MTVRNGDCSKSKNSRLSTRGSRIGTVGEANFVKHARFNGEMSYRFNDPLPLAYCEEL